MSEKWRNADGRFCRAVVSAVNRRAAALVPVNDHRGWLAMRRVLWQAIYDERVTTIGDIP